MKHATTTFLSSTRVSLLAAALPALLAACAMTPPAQQPMVDNAQLPEAVRAPSGHQAAWHTTGTGQITYECRDRKDMPGQQEWAFVAPVATLTLPGGKIVGKYFAGPTWQANDGSSVTGKQLAVSPVGAGNIPLQLVKASPGVQAGDLQQVSYIQRLNTKGGVAPSLPCGPDQKGQKQQVDYQADYVFYKPTM
jgi:hypothetical protein